MKKNFKAHIVLDKNVKKTVQINTIDIKKRIQFILTLVCDFPTEVSIKFCDEEEMTQTNKSFRNKNKSTDVLSFPNTFFSSEESSYYLGDILICIPVCLQQAKKYKIPLAQELEKMIIHGIAHLKGFDHERSDSAWAVMTSLEASIQKELTKNLKKPAWCEVVL